MPRVILCLLLLSVFALLGAQNTLALSGLNEAKFVYRTVPDSLHAYFSDTFSFGMSYRDFSFGMAFVAELPKYSTNQSELLEDLVPERLNLGWKDLYVSYAKKNFLLHAGTIEETFGSGIAFRSYKDLEWDLDKRVTGFKFGYDDDLKIKALYSAIPGDRALDLAYGADVSYLLPWGMTLGGTGVQFRYLNPFGAWNTNSVGGGRLKAMLGPLDFSGEYYLRELLRPETGLDPIEGSAAYATASLSFTPVQFGGAFKRYQNFQYNLQDMPLANHHGETLADNQSTGIDETGVQGWVNLTPLDNLSLLLDYAEAWNTGGVKRMNDAYAGLDWTLGKVVATLSYSHVEKVDTLSSHWQQETYPAAHLSFPFLRSNMVVAAEFKTVRKQDFEVLKTHYEPKLQADISFGKLALSVGAGTSVEDLSDPLTGTPWANFEAKYPVLDNTELVLFGGSEPGGKVCRNGVCRYVAPFSGLRLELITRF